MSTSILVALIVQAASEEPAAVSLKKEEAAPYRTAVAVYRDAVELIERREWKRAEERLTTVIDDPAIKHRECRLKLQQRDSTWLPLQEFYPRYARATARIELALECLERKDPAAAAPWVRGAAVDVDEAAAAKVPGSHALRIRIADAVDRVRDSMLDAEASEAGALAIPKSHAARYRRAVDLLRASADALRTGDTARTLSCAEEACSDVEIPDEHVERLLLLRDASKPELVEFRPLTARGEAALAHARTLRGPKAKDAARLARDSLVLAVRRGTPGLDGKIADAEALLAAAESPDVAPVPVTRARPKGAIWPAIAIAFALLGGALAALSRNRSLER